MAVQGPIPVEFGTGVPARGVRGGGRSSRCGTSRRPRPAGSCSRRTRRGLPLWVVDVIDGDPLARDKTARVKVAAADQPVLPAPAAGLPFVPVEFAGLTVTPYVNQAGRLAYSLKATGVRARARRPRWRGAGERGMSGPATPTRRSAPPRRAGPHPGVVLPRRRPGSAWSGCGLTGRTWPYPTATCRCASARRPGPVTAEDARIARHLADQAAEYAAAIERLSAASRRLPNPGPQPRLPGIRRHEQGGAAGAGTSGRPFLRPSRHSKEMRRGDHRMRGSVRGEQYAQVDNHDPFAPPAGGPRSTAPPSGHLARPARSGWVADRLVPGPPSAAGPGGRGHLAGLAAGGLARPGRPGGRHRWPRSRAAGVAAGLVRPAGDRPGAGPVAVVVLPAPLARRAARRRARAPRYRAGSGPGARQGSRGPLRRPGGRGLVSGQAPDDFADKAEPGARVRGALCAGSAPARPAQSSWSWSAATPSRS